MYPSKPDFLPLVSNSEREKLFGKIEYTHAPIKGNPENISIKGDWARKNLCIIDLPQLLGIQGAPKSGKIQCHIKVADSIRFLFAELEADNLLNEIHTWNGMFNPRFIRGSKTTLSNHAYGTAFDINAQWNPLNKEPAAEGKLGCVYKIVHIANKHGWYWGGHYSKRKDGMHFEYVYRG